MVAMCARAAYGSRRTVARAGDFGDLMMAMHYRVPLDASVSAVMAIRRRTEELGPRFDGFPGLAHKYFLLDPDEACYATFYLWTHPDAALDFLEGGFFAALSAKFGRPRVRLLLTTHVRLPTDDPAFVTIAENDSAIVCEERIDAIDPTGGQRLSLVLCDAHEGQRFELLYHARGQCSG